YCAQRGRAVRCPKFGEQASLRLVLAAGNAGRARSRRLVPRRRNGVFDLDQFVSDCRALLGQEAAQPAVREVVARAVSEPSSVVRALGEPTRGGISVLHQSPELTVLNVVWAPWMTLLPHNHLMWALIGVYSGREDNIFWR